MERDWRNHLILPAWTKCKFFDHPQHTRFNINATVHPLISTFIVHDEMHTDAFDGILNVWLALLLIIGIKISKQYSTNSVTLAKCLM